MIPLRSISPIRSGEWVSTPHPYPSPPFVTLGDETSQARKGVERDLVEGVGGVSVPEVPRPAAQEPVEVLHDIFDRFAEPATVRELTDPIAGRASSPAVRASGRGTSDASKRACCRAPSGDGSRESPAPP